MPAKLILIEGKPGTGKSTAWESMPPEESLVIRPNTKDLPFKGARAKYQEGKNLLTTTNLRTLPTMLQQANEQKHIKYILIDDFTHFFNARLVSDEFRAKGRTSESYARWADLAADTAKVIVSVADQLRDDLYIFINGHTSTNNVTGEETLLTPGVMLDQKIQLPSYFTYIFHTHLENEGEDAKYYFLTNTAFGKEAKTPKGSFAKLKIPNDNLSIVKTIEEYQNDI